MYSCAKRRSRLETPQQEETLKWIAPAVAADTPPINNLLTLSFPAEISKPLSCGRHSQEMSRLVVTKLPVSIKVPAQVHLALPGPGSEKVRSVPYHTHVRRVFQQLTCWCTLLDAQQRQASLRISGNAALEECSACGLKALLQGSLQRLRAPDCEAIMGQPGGDCTHPGREYWGPGRRPSIGMVPYAPPPS